MSVHEKVACGVVVAGLLGRTLDRLRSRVGTIRAAFTWRRNND